MQKIKKIHLTILIFLVAFAVYSQTLTYGFVYDDAFFTGRQDYRELHHIFKVFVEPLAINNLTAGTYRPLPMASFVLTYGVLGESPLYFHLGNVVLHAIVSVLIFYVVLGLGIQIWPALAASILFAVHPVHVEAVANIKSRDEILFGLFFLLSLMTAKIIRGRRTSLAIASTSICFLMGLFSKEMALVTPIVILLLSKFVWKVSGKHLIVLLLSFLPSVIFYGWLRSIALGTSFFGEYTGPFPGNMLYEASFLVRLLTGLKIYALYLSKLIIPLHLSASYAYKAFVPVYSISEIAAWLPGAIVVVISITAGIYTWVRNQRLTTMFIASWYVLYIMISQIPFAKGDIIAERWIYVPSIILIVLLTHVGYKICSKKKLYLLILGIISLLFFIRTTIRNPVWKSNEILFESMTQDAPQSVIAHTLLAETYLKSGNYAGSATHAALAEKIYPDYAQLQNLLGSLKMIEKSYDLARKYYEKSLKLDPQLTDTYALLGSLHYATEEYETAEKYFKTIIDKQNVPQYTDIISYAAVLFKLKRYEESRSMLALLSESEKALPQAQMLTKLLQNIIIPTP